ncbi:MAG: 2-dehydropantoate 2-reductase [Verrucomicrobiota bacterium JB023]|nr:2-dehydropantoate 2-reductase [Verrucomicrobiota bacterium JB023]
MIRTIGIVGTGAIGGYYGCRLLEAGKEVKFLLRSDYEEVKSNGFTVKSVDGDMKVAYPSIFQSTREMGPVDLVIVTWKSTANKHFEHVIRPLMHEDTKILTLQNGLGNVEELEALFGQGRVMGGLCFVRINRLGGGVISHMGGGKITMGEFSESGSLHEVASLFGPKVKTRPVDNLGRAQWEKLVWNIPFNGLCVTEGGVDTRKLMQMPGMEAKCREVMEEVLAGANALGFTIPHAFVDEMIHFTRGMGAYKPSTLIDYLENREIEVEAIWGEPYRRATAAGVALPRLGELYENLQKVAQQTCLV